MLKRINIITKLLSLIIIFLLAVSHSSLLIISLLISGLIIIEGQDKMLFISLFILLLSTIFNEKIGCLIFFFLYLYLIYKSLKSRDKMFIYSLFSKNPKDILRKSYSIKDQYHFKNIYFMKKLEFTNFHKMPLLFTYTDIIYLKVLLIIYLFNLII